MTDEEIKKIYKNQLDQHYLNFLEKRKRRNFKIKFKFRNTKEELFLRSKINHKNHK